MIDQEQKDILESLCIPSFTEFCIEESKKSIDKAMRHKDRFGAGAMRRKRLSSDDKFETVMKEYGKNRLHSGSGEKVKDQKQALAIAFSEAGRSKKK